MKIKERQNTTKSNPIVKMSNDSALLLHRFYSWTLFLIFGIKIENNKQSNSLKIFFKFPL